MKRSSLLLSKSLTSFLARRLQDGRDQVVLSLATMSQPVPTLHLTRQLTHAVLHLRLKLPAML